MLLLQDKAGLSFKEARVALADSAEERHSIAEEYGITQEAVSNLARRGRNKISGTGMTLEGICEGYYLPEVLRDPR
ncbi:MAG: hypothetical protein LBG62_06655 [Candidatus Methanoplasma sp.]|jgi:hypothetical protein|nr:hypothetical protein [Candidatus Methanoplasma sp.]